MNEEKAQQAEPPPLEARIEELEELIVRWECAYDPDSKGMLHLLREAVGLGQSMLQRTRRELRKG